MSICERRVAGHPGQHRSRRRTSMTISATLSFRGRRDMVGRRSSVAFRMSVGIPACVLATWGSSSAPASAKRVVHKHVKSNEPECPSSTYRCYIDVTLRQNYKSVCSSFDNRDGFCLGSSIGTASWVSGGYVEKIGLRTDFDWTSPGPKRDVTWTASDDFVTVAAKIVGKVPSSSSCDFNVTDTWTRLSGVHWQTGTAGKCGTADGPLYIEYYHPASGLGSQIHIYGYMEPIPTPPEPSSAWTLCASEEHRCDPPQGSYRVSYGTAGHYLYRDVSGPIGCDNRDFGGDPLGHYPKACWYQPR